MSEIFDEKPAVSAPPTQSSFKNVIKEIYAQNACIQLLE